MAASATAQDEVTNGDTTTGKEKSPEEIDLASHGSEKDSKEEDDCFETGSTVSTKIQNLRNNKKSAKTRLTKIRNQLKDLVENHPSDAAMPSKNAIRRAINKVRSEAKVIEKIIANLKQVYATSGEFEGTDTIIESLDKELDEILTSVDLSIDTAENHLQQRLANGEAESIVPSLTKSGDAASSIASISTSYVKQKQREAKEAKERLLEMEQEQRQKEKEIEKLTAQLQITKQRTDEARKVVELNQSRAEAAERASGPRDSDLECHARNPLPPSWQQIEDPNIPRMDYRQPLPKAPPIRLKGVPLPKFSGEDKTDYESWKAAFMSMVDLLDIPVGEKMLRLQNSLTGKALALVKDLGFSMSAYERAKVKLDKKYGGERRLQIKHLTTLRGWPKVRPRNLEDMEEFQAVLERVMIALQDSGPGRELQGQNLNLTAKEKLAEEDVQAYKHWLLDRSLEDNFQTLVEWVELRVQIMEESKEETRGLVKKTDRQTEERKSANRNERTRARGFHARSKPRNCIVSTCKEDHPPWVCKAFKGLPVQQRKELISNAGRCYRCLAAGHQSRDCPNARRCGVEECQSTNHSSYLHDSSLVRAVNKPDSQFRVGTTPFQPRMLQHLETRSEVQNSSQMPATSHPREQTYKTSHVEHVSLMILPALITNGKKHLKVNVMLDPCSTSSYISDDAAEELELQGEAINLTIAGTAGTEITTRSRRVDLSVLNLDGSFSGYLQAHVLNNITGDTPAIPWSEVKERWPHLRSVSFPSVSRRRQIDVMIGSDHPVFHHVLQEICGSQPNDPVARLTNLGWVCFGPTLVEEFRRDSRSHFTRTYRSSPIYKQPAPDDILRSFWELESLGIKDNVEQPMTTEEVAAVKQAAETLEFQNGRYKIGIPWKDSEPKLADIYDIALMRLKSQEKSLKRKDLDIAYMYCQVFEDYLKKGYIQKLTKSQDKEQWFLPHFPVVREDKVTTKVRVVFDAAVKHNGKSLNDTIRPGPKLQRELVDVLTRFRRSPVSLSGDISEMFLQVELAERDRQYHRFLWRDLDTSRQPDVYEFQRLLFGNTASSFLSQYVLHSHAQAHALDFPEAANSVDNSMYVDDLLDSCETVESAQQLHCKMKRANLTQKLGRND